MLWVLTTDKLYCLEICEIKATMYEDMLKSNAFTVINKPTYTEVWTKMHSFNNTCPHFCVKFHSSAITDIWITAVKNGVIWGDNVSVE